MSLRNQNADDQSWQGTCADIADACGPLRQDVGPERDYARFKERLFAELRNLDFYFAGSRISGKSNLQAAQTFGPVSQKHIEGDRRCYLLPALAHIRISAWREPDLKP